MPTPVTNRRWVALVAAALALILLLVACGSDPEPTATTAPTPVPPTAMPQPEPTPTPQPEATPAPAPTATSMPAPTSLLAPTATAAPAPTAASVSPQPMMALEELVITLATTGGDLMALLSEQEASCIQTSVGESMYQLIQVAPVVMMAAGDISQTAPLFNCLAEENVVYLAVAFLDLQAGGWEEESRKCITEVGLAHPDSVYVRLGLHLSPDPIDPSLTLDHNVQIYECLSLEEQKEFTIALWTALDRHSPATGADILGLFSESEIACVRESLSDEQLVAIAVAKPLQAVSMGTAAAHCFDPETNDRIFANGIGWSIGGVADETLSCLEDFARDYPDFTALLSSGLEGIQSMSTELFIEVSDVGQMQYECMTEEELMRVQLAATAALAMP